jgi:mannose-6-phosphate isomerase-like protein (cupin superfamily)
MTDFESRHLPPAADVIAPDGSEVRILPALPAGGLAHFTLAPRAVSVPVRHRTVSEIWYFLTGAGQMWRRQDDREEVVDVSPGLSITIPVGTAFQFRSTSDEPLVAIGVTMPPWPGDEEAVRLDDGRWSPTV